MLTTLYRTFDDNGNISPSIYVIESQEPVMLTIRVERAEDVAVINCEGRIVRGQECILEKAVLAQEDARMIVLDLSDVEALDAGGVSLLVSLHRWTESRQAHLKLVNPRPFVYDMLTRTHLDCVFDISSLNHALAVLGNCECNSRPAHAAA
jgi:anti-anti-sigma factor